MGFESDDVKIETRGEWDGGLVTEVDAHLTDSLSVLDCRGSGS